MAKKFALIFIFSFLNLLLLASARTVGLCRPVTGPEGTPCTGPNANWQTDGVCLEQDDRLACEVPNTRNFRFRLIARVQKNGDRTIENLWVRGSGPQLSWNEPTQLRQSARLDTWTLDISYTSDSDGILCPDSSQCTLNQNALELRFYKSQLMSDGMKGPNIYIPLPISKSMTGTVNFITPTVKVFPWFDSTAIRTERFQLPCRSTICRINSPITSFILYPPSFDSNTAKKYPLVITFGEIEATIITPLLEKMYAYEASIEEAVVVSIHYRDAAPFCAFNPYDQIVSTAKTATIWRCRGTNRLCFKCQNCWDTQRPTKCSRGEFLSRARECLIRYPCRGAAGDILDFIELTLLPELQERTQNRLKLDFPHQRISVIGYSGAGLLACHAALSRPWYYGNAACMSATFHWPLGTDIVNVVNNRSTEGIGATFSELAFNLGIDQNKKGLYVTQKYYIDNGENDNFYLPYIDAHNYSQWIINHLTKTLHLPPENILYFNIPGGGNNDVHLTDGKVEVLHRIRQPLVFFLKPSGGPSEKYTRIPRIDESIFTNNIMLANTGEYQINLSISNMRGHCAFRRTTDTGIHPDVFVVSIVIIALLSVGLTFAFMFLRERNMRAKQKAKDEDEEDEDEDSFDDDDMNNFETAKDVSLEKFE